MKRLFLTCLLYPGITHAKRPGGLNSEAMYIYLGFIVMVLVIVGADRGIKYLRKKRPGAIDSMTDEKTAPHN